jgi:L-fucose mutarotase
MLIGIDPILRGPLLAALDEMGHGDLLVIADANFPGHRISDRVIDVQCADAPTVMRAVASVFPIDADVPVALMASPTGRLPVQDELVNAAGRGDDESSVTELSRLAFYDEAGQAYLILLTGERRSYGNLLVRKGVVV